MERGTGETIARDHLTPKLDKEERRLQNLDKMEEQAFFNTHTSEAEAEAARHEHRKPKLSQSEREFKKLDEEYRQEATELRAGLKEHLETLRKLDEDLEKELRKTEEPIRFEVIQSAIDLRSPLEALRKPADNLDAIKMRDPRQTE